MGLVTLNGVDCPADYPSGAERDEEEIGPGPQEAYDGSLLRSNLGFKRRWSLMTSPDTQANSQAMRQYMRGDVDHITWASDNYSDKGITHSSKTAGATITLGTGGKYNGKVNLSANTDNIVFPTGLGSAWTVMFWSQIGAGAQSHFIQRSDNVNWTNGVQGSGSLGLCSVSSGNTTLSSSSSNRNYSDPVFFNFLIPTSWGPSLYTFCTGQAWTVAPRLLTGGDLAASGVTVIATPGKSKILQVVLSGTFNDNAEMMAFDLKET